MATDYGFNFEAWTLPNAGTYQKKFDITKMLESWDFNLRHSGNGEGSFEIDRTYSRLPDLLTVDSANHANDVGSMIRIRRGSDYIKGGDFVLYEINRQNDSDKGTYPGILQGPEFLLDTVKVRRFDDPKNPSLDPDWEYGSPSVIKGLGDEVAKEVQQIWHNATSGEFTLTDGTDETPRWAIFWGLDAATTGDYKLSDGTDTTLAINYNDSAATIETRIETDWASVSDVTVTGTGSFADPFVITPVTPAGFIPDLSIVSNTTDANISVGIPLDIATVDTTDLRNAIEVHFAAANDVSVSGSGTALDPWTIEFNDPTSYPQITIGTNATDGVFSVDTITEGGSLSPRPWHQSYHPVTGVQHGTYQTFSIGTTTVFPGDTYSLELDADSLPFPTDYSGAQVIENVVGGRSYNAKIPVLSQGIAQTVRLVVRDMQENFIAASPDLEVAADTWTWLEVPNPFVIPDGVEEVIYRVGIIENNNANPVFIAIEQAFFIPGYYAAPVGAILLDQIQALNLEGDLTWVTPTWTDTLDSDGNAWDQDRQWKITHKQSLLQVLEYAVKWGYRFSFYYDDVSSEFRWDMFNPGAGPVVSGVSLKARESSGGGDNPVRFPKATLFDAEGAFGEWAEYEDTVMSTAWGRIHGHLRDDRGLDQGGLLDLATEQVEVAKRGSDAASLTFQNPDKLPFDAYQLGDQVEFDSSPLGSKRTRVVTMVNVSKGKGEAAPKYTVHGDTEVFASGGSAMASNVRTLIRKVDSLGQGAGIEKRERTWDPAMFNFGSETIGAGGAIPWLVASSDSPQAWQDMAGTVITLGDDAGPTIESTLTTYEYCKLAPGTFRTFFAGGVECITMPNFSVLEGSGQLLTIVEDRTQSNPVTYQAIIGVGYGCEVRDLGVYANSWWNTTAIRITRDFVNIERVYAECWEGDNVGSVRPAGINIQAGASDIRITDSFLVASSSGARTVGDGNDWESYALHIEAPSDTIWVSRCKIRGGTYGIYVNENNGGNFGYLVQIRGCEIGWGSGWDALRVETGLTGDTASGVFYFTNVTDNKFIGWGGDALLADLAAAIHYTSNGAFTGELGDTAGQVIPPNMIQNNSIEAGSGSYGIVIEDWSGAVISDNYLEGCLRGIHLDNSDDSQILDNLMLWCGGGSGTSAYAPIEVNDSDRVRIQGNAIKNERGNTASHPDYGIRINDAASDNCVVVGNDLRNPGEAFVTAPILDNGTGTLFDWPADATYGDNFT